MQAFHLYAVRVYISGEGLVGSFMAAALNEAQAKDVGGRWALDTLGADNIHESTLRVAVERLDEHRPIYTIESVLA